MRTEVIGRRLSLPGLGVPERPIIVHRFDIPVRILRRLAEDDVARCAWCSEDYFQHGKRTWDWVHYDSPWGEELVDTICPRCRDSYFDEWHVDGYFECDWCERTIADSHGHRSYRRTLDGDEICASCYQNYALASNDLVERFIHGEQVPIADFYDYEELGKLGFHEHDAFFYAGDPTGDLKRRLRRDLAEGWQVVVDMGSTSIMGDEGWLNIWVKDPTETEAGHAPV